MVAVLLLLILHGLIGGADVLLNHELRERLPSQVFARSEQALHGTRELIFALLFGALAWREWHGPLAWGIAILLLLEFSISWRDTLLEDRTRQLSGMERSMHMLLFINFGAYTACLAPILFQWQALPAGTEAVHYGILSWVLSALALASLAWSIRDLIAYAALGQKARSMAASQ